MICTVVNTVHQYSIISVELPSISYGYAETEIETNRSMRSSCSVTANCEDRTRTHSEGGLMPHIAHMAVQALGTISTALGPYQGITIVRYFLFSLFRSRGRKPPTRTRHSAAAYRGQWVRGVIYYGSSCSCTQHHASQYECAFFAGLSRRTGYWFSASSALHSTSTVR